MKKIAVVYRSKSGFTHNYAGWLAQAAGADLLLGEKTKLNDLMAYDIIVYGGGLYATGINGLKLITKNYHKLKTKKLLVFCLGATPVRPEIYEEVKNKNFTLAQQKNIKFFMLRGGFDYNKLKPFDKILMRLLKAKLKSRKRPTPDEVGMLKAYSHPFDFTNVKEIKPILEAIEKD